MDDTITPGDAKFIAENLVKLHHTISSIKEPVLRDGTWIVEVEVSSPDRQKFQVEVNSRTGDVKGF